MYKKIDNVLGNNVLSELQYRILEGNIPWYFGEATAYKNSSTGPLDFSFSHLIFNNGEAVSPLFDTVLMSFLKCLDQAEQKLDQLYRMRLGLITATSKSITHGAHVDMDTLHKTALFYLNNSDGDTILYDNVYELNSSLDSEAFLKTQTLTELKRITPKENTFLSFDGLRYHSSSTPILTKKRIVLNINYSVK